MIAHLLEQPLCLAEKALEAVGAERGGKLLLGEAPGVKLDVDVLWVCVFVSVFFLLLYESSTLILYKELSSSLFQSLSVSQSVRADFDFFE